MSTRSLPARPNLDQLKRQANELQEAHRLGDVSAAARIAAHHPRRTSWPPEQVLAKRLMTADAQLVIAREYGFADWAALRHHVETIASLAGFVPHPRFADALAALDAGNVRELRRLLNAEPALALARSRLEAPYDYFTGATLLHHVAGNPDRGVPLPPNIVDVTAVLIDAGADVQARTLGPDGGTVMGLLLTSKRASEADATGPMIDLLMAHGAELDVHADGALDASLANHAPRAAEKLIDLGAVPDVVIAAALGRLDVLRDAFDSNGLLRAKARRQGRDLADRDATGLALLFAYVREQREAVAFLLGKDANLDVTGVGNGTLLHRAAWNGDLAMVRQLVARGADITVRDPEFGASPMAWASYNSQRGVFDWMVDHCLVDIHDAVTFGLTQQVAARLDERLSSIHTRRRQWELLDATPLHCAALAKRHDMVALLLDRGADPAAVAGNGVTALDIAEYQGATRIARLLEERGGTRSSEAAKRSAEPAMRPFEKLAGDVLEAYRTGADAAVQRVQALVQARLTAWDIRRAVRMRLQKGRTSGDGAEAELSISEARDVVAGARGFPSWGQLVESVTRFGKTWGRPLYQVDDEESRLTISRPVLDDEWREIIAVLSDKRIRRLDAGGQMTDEAMARISELPHVTAVQLQSSRRVTDAGLRHLARLPQLNTLNLSGCSFTDAGLSVLRELPALETFELHWHKGVSDEGVAHLEACEQLARVNVMGSPVGDGLLQAMSGKRHLRHLNTGTHTTDAALPLLHRIPQFRTWHGGEPRLSLMAAEGEPNHLMLDGPFTDAGLQALRGLEGLFGISFFWHSTSFTTKGLAVLTALPRLGFVGHEGQRCTDEAMRIIAAIPALRMLQAQGTVATDQGFTALSRSSTLEYLWGRDCPNLGGEGFRALAAMPSLRGLAVSLRRVDDASLALLAQSQLRELMPVNLQDAGFRHIGRCESLEQLWCMYCRDTTDAATEQVAGLSKLRTYYAGQTQITDRSLEILSGMASLELLEFWNCAGLTDEGAALLARLPRLREVAFDSCRHVTHDVTTLFASGVRARWSA